MENAKEIAVGLVDKDGIYTPFWIGFQDEKCLELETDALLKEAKKLEATAFIIADSNRVLIVERKNHSLLALQCRLEEKVNYFNTRDVGLTEPCQDHLKIAKEFLASNPEDTTIFKWIDFISNESIAKNYAD